MYKNYNIYDILNEQNNTNKYNKKELLKHTDYKNKQNIIINNNIFNKNKKKILCSNYLKNKQCKYKNKCIYAHGLHDQFINKHRKIIYDMIDNNISFFNINLVENIKIFRILLIHTKLCDKCIANTCLGGYNCKNGIYDNKYLVCYNDLINGYCNIKNCNSIHLTQKGLICYNDKKNNIFQHQNIILFHNDHFINNISDQLNNQNNILSKGHIENDNINTITPKSIFEIDI